MSGVHFGIAHPTSKVIMLLGSNGMPLGKLIPSVTRGMVWADLYGLHPKLCDSVQEAKDWMLTEAMKMRMMK